MSLVGALLKELQEECSYCGGDGHTLDLSKRTMPLPKLHCYPCHGRGWVLSGLGDELLRVLSPALAEQYATADHIHPHH